MKKNNLNILYSENGFESRLKEALIDQNFYEGLLEDPQSTIKKVSQSLNYASLIKKHKGLQCRPLTQVILEAPDYDDNPKFLAAKNLVLEIFKNLNYNWTLAQNKLISEGLSIVEAQVLSIQQSLKLPKYETIKIKEVFTEGNISPDQAKRIVSSFILATSLIPDEYKKNVDNLELILSTEQSRSLSFKESEKGSSRNTIILNIQKNMLEQIAEGLHEYMHLIEIKNSKVLERTNNFLLAQRTSPLLKTIKEHTFKYKKDKENSSELIYETNLINYYAGKAYGVIDSKKTPTEILSVGMELLFKNPLEFYIKDPTYFNFLIKTLS